VWFLQAMPSLRRLTLALGAIARLGALAASSALASTTQEAMIQDNNLTHDDPTGTTATFQALGASMEKITIYWNAFAPNPNSTKPPKGFNGANPADYAASKWAWLDNAVRQAKLAKIRVGFQVDAPAPIWAAGKGNQQHPSF